jgi:hypothetical protein
LSTRLSTNCACGSGALTRRIGSSAKNGVPSGIASTSPENLNSRRASTKASENRPLARIHARSPSAKASCVR